MLEVAKAKFVIFLKKGHNILLAVRHLAVWMVPLPWNFANAKDASAGNPVVIPRKMSERCII